MPAERCPQCDKPSAVCLCKDFARLPNTLRFLVIQHPQEPKELLGTARVLATQLENVQVVVGLSWRNLKHALGDENAVPTEWGVLYLGSGVKGPSQAPLQIVDKKGVPLEPGENSARLHRLKGILLLDGTWSQAKALWWRNAWLLKLPRLILKPSEPSLYGKLRKEPRRECLSTLESAAECLKAMDPSDPSASGLKERMREFLRRTQRPKNR